MKQIAKTERLYLRELTEGDAAFIVSLVNTPAWLQYIGDKKVSNEADAVRYLTDGPMKSYRQHGFGLWCVCLNGLATPIGICGILKRDTLESPDIGFALLPDYEGVGYAQEAAKATIEIAASRFDLKDLAAITTKDNGRSIALLQRLGFRKPEAVVPAENGVGLLLFKMKLSM